MTVFWCLFVSSNDSTVIFSRRKAQLTLQTIYQCYRSFSRNIKSCVSVVKIMYQTNTSEGPSAILHKDILNIYNFFRTKSSKVRGAQILKDKSFLQPIFFLLSQTLCESQVHHAHLFENRVHHIEKEFRSFVDPSLALENFAMILLLRF